MALFGAKHKIYFSFLNLSSSVLKCKKLKYQLSEFCLIVSEGPTNPIIDCITETSTFTRFCRDDGQDTPGLSLALCNFISSHFSIIFLILSLSALLEEDILICKRVKILPSTSGPQRPAMVNHRNSDRIWHLLTMKVGKAVFPASSLPRTSSVTRGFHHCRNDSDMHSIALIILINTVMSQGSLRDWHKLWCRHDDSPEFRISDVTKWWPSITS